MFETLIHRYNKKIISFQKRETNWNFTGCQVPHFKIVLIPYINLLNLFDNKISIFEEYEAFKIRTSLVTNYSVWIFRVNTVMT